MRRLDLGVVLKDLGTRFHVDDDAPPGGDGGEARPFATIAEALVIGSPGDTVQLAPGTYDQPLELIPHVTILGAGAGRTRVAGEAHWGLALRPFITYYGGRGEDMWAVHRPGVTMAGFTFDGGGEYPDRPAEEVSDLLAVVTAIGHRTLGTYATAEDVATSAGAAAGPSRSGRGADPGARRLAWGQHPAAPSGQHLRGRHRRRVRDRPAAHRARGRRQRPGRPGPRPG